MNYRHILVLTNVGRDPRPTFAALRCYVASAEHLTVLALQEAHQLASTGMTPQPPRDHEDGSVAALETLWRTAGPSTS